MPDPATIWKRRVVLMAAIGLVVAIPATLLIRGGDDGDAPPADETVLTSAPTVPRKVDRKLAVAVHLPEGWRSKRRGGVLTMRNKDRSAAVIVSAPGPADSADRILEQAVAAVRAQYRRVKVVDKASGQRLGGRKARSVTLTAARPADGGRLGIIVAVARGKQRAYLVEVFTRATNPGLAPLEAQAVLNQLRFKR